MFKNLAGRKFETLSQLAGTLQGDSLSRRQSPRLDQALSRQKFLRGATAQEGIGGPAAFRIQISKHPLI
jgi:hypothetical protein